MESVTKTNHSRAGIQGKTKLNQGVIVGSLNEAVMGTVAS